MYYLPLSELELKILELLAFGKTDAQIAIQLCLSRYAVSKHIKSINGKLFVVNRIPAVVLGVQLGLIAPSIKQVPCSEQALQSEKTYKLASKVSKVELNPVPWNLLTEREVEILLCFEDDQVSNAEIATRLYVSQNTVRGHLRRMYKKLGLNRTNLCELAGKYILTKNGHTN